MKRYLLLLILCPLASFGQTGDLIHIDQFGYSLHAHKVAVISNPQIGYNANLNGYTPTTTFVVKDAASNQTVFAAQLQVWNGGNTHTNSGDKGWWFDFSALQTNGEYYIMDTVSNKRSYNFKIKVNPYYEVLKDAGRMFYYNRCNAGKPATYAGTKWQDGINFMNANQDNDCHRIHDSLNLYPVRDLSGGWFDAGDYNKYVSFAFSTLHDLLYAYEENPDAFSDDWNIPESGNGIPDIIDEIKWETDWLLKMVDSNGRCPVKMGSKDYSDNSSTPPSSNTDPRYYGPNCTSASITAASMLAHAGIVMQQFPALSQYVDSLKFKAKVALDYTRPLYFANSLEYNCDDGSIISGDADRDSTEQVSNLMTASVYLWELTNDAPSKSFIDFNYFVMEDYVNNSWNVYNSTLLDALVRYAQHPNAHANAANGINTNVQQTVTNNWSDYFGWNDSDLYRAPVPSWTYHWGSNSIVASYANLNDKLAQYNIGADSINQRKRSSETLHYFHGVNPNGLVYLSNMYHAGSSNCINEIYHSWFADGSIYDHAQTSLNGPPPGYLVGGPNEYFGYASLTPPYGQPRQKSYLDFNTGWPQGSWEVSEPAIYYQAAYIRLLSKYVQKVVAPSSTNSITKTKLSVHPNPTNNKVYVTGLTDKAQVSIFDLSGRLIFIKSINEGDHSIDLGNVTKGMYMLRIGKEEFKILKE